MEAELKAEAQVLKKLKKQYKEALDGINDNIAALKARTDTENLQSIVYQVQYQEALKTQISGILDDLESKQFTTVSEYLTECYENGFLGAMYDIHDQGIPIIFPIDQKQVVNALTVDSKLSKPLYTKLGESTTKLKHNLQRNLSRGIAQGESYYQIAQSMTKEMVGDYSRFRGGAFYIAERIVRTEGHRITNQAKLDSMQKAIDAGADVVKQWDATLDRRTRPEHAKADGQIREMDEDFEVWGEKLPAPGVGGSARNVINCRCRCLQRAKWALDDDELQTLKDRAAYYGLDKTEDFEDFKQKYLKISEAELQALKDQWKIYQEQQDAIIGKYKDFDDFFINGSIDDLGEYTQALDDQFEVGQKLTKNGVDTLDLKLAYQQEQAEKAAALKAAAKAEADEIKKLQTKWEKYDSEMESIKGKYKDDIDFVTNGTAKDKKKFWKLQDKADEVEKQLNALKVDPYELKVKNAEAAAKKAEEKVKKLEKDINNSQKKLNKIPNKTYSGIWKEDVDLSDYQAKKASIKAKKQYYEDEIVKLTSDPDDFPKWKSDKVDKYLQYIEDLEEYEKLGEQYSEKYVKLKTKIDKLQDDLAKVTGTSKTAKGFSPSAYTPEAKAKVKFYTSADDADAMLRPKLDKQWKDLSDSEKYGLWKYTENSNPLNKPLSGYHDGWSRSNFVGVGKARWSYEDAWRSNPSKFKKFGHSNGTVDHFKAITDLTKAIDKCELDTPMKLTRGSDIGGFAGLLEGSNISFDQAKRLLESGDIDTLQQLLEGQSFQNHAFTSTGIAKGTGFSGNVMYEIYAPSGTKAIYAEPQSYFGNTISGAELYTPGHSHYGVGHEAEMILQRGTTFRITEIKKEAGYGNYYRVKMEVVEQPDYFKYGDEETFNNGATRHKD